MGFGYHRASTKKLHAATVENGCPTPVLDSAGALVDAIKEQGFKKVFIICTFMKPLTKLVVDYIEHEGIEVQDFLALEIPDSLEVASQDQTAPAELWRKLDLSGVDAIVASACVQMPSFPSIAMIERASGLPTLSASIATPRQILRQLGLTEVAPGGGVLLSTGIPAALQRVAWPRIPTRDLCQIL